MYVYRTPLTLVPFVESSREQIATPFSRDIVIENPASRLFDLGFVSNPFWILLHTSSWSGRAYFRVEMTTPRWLMRRPEHIGMAITKRWCSDTALSMLSFDDILIFAVAACSGHLCGAAQVGRVRACFVSSAQCCGRRREGPSSPQVARVAFGWRRQRVSAGRRGAAEDVERGPCANHNLTGHRRRSSLVYLI